MYMYMYTSVYNFKYRGQRLYSKPKILNTLKEFIKCRIKMFPYIHGSLYIFANTVIYVK